MRRNVWPVILGLIAGVLYAIWAISQDDGEGATVTDKLVDGFWNIINRITQGKRVTNAPYSKTTGVVPGSPDSLAAVAGVDVETYSLARNIASEEGNSTTATQAAVGWATKNHADLGGVSITTLLTRAKNASHAGHYGTQKDIDKDLDPDDRVTIRNGNYGKSDRYASTALDPYEGHIAIAQGILDGTIPDITGGADQYDRPAAEGNPDAVAANREKSGSELVDVSDYADPGLRFWRKI